MNFSISSKTSKGVFLTLVICFAALLFFNGYSSVEAKETVILNSGTYKSCEQICNEELGTQCLSIGTDPDGTDGKWYAPAIWAFCNHNKDGTCDRKMVKSLTGKKCDGILTQWTNCRCAEPKKPDFEVIRFAGPSTVAVNETFSYHSTVKNIGEGDSLKTVSPRGIIYYAGSREVCGYGLWQGSMRAGGTEDTSCSYFKFSSPGNYKIKVCVDPDNEIDEKNENNNCEEKTVNVKAEEIPSDYYFQSPSEDSPTKTDKCYLRHYTSPTTYTDVLQYECGPCSYIPSNQCSGDIKGSCTKYANNTSCGDGRWCLSGECMEYYWKVVDTQEGWICSGSKTQCNPEQYGNKRYSGKAGSSWSIERYVRCGWPGPFVKNLIYECSRQKVGGGCTSHAYCDCYDNDVYWYDSCGRREEKREECGSAGCENGVCKTEIPSDYYFQSPSEDSPEKIDKCYLRHYTGPDPYTDYVDTLQYECGACLYVPSDQCTGEIKGSCTKYQDNTSCGTNRWCLDGKCMQYYWEYTGGDSGPYVCSGTQTKCNPEQYGNKRYSGDAGSDASIERYVH